MQLLASITFGQVLLTVLEIALLATLIWVAVSVILDVYRSPDLAPAAKAGWIFVIVRIPLLGVMIYVIARGDKMSEHEIGGERWLEDLRDRGVLRTKSSSAPATGLPAGLWRHEPMTSLRSRT